MYYLTAIRQEQSQTAALKRAAVFMYLREKDRMQTVFACVGEQGIAGCLADAWRENSAKWCRSGKAETVLRRAERDLRRTVGKLTGSWALLCAADGLCFYARQGDAEIRLLNTRFGRSSVRTLTRMADPPVWEWAETEAQVGILLGSSAFWNAVGERDLTEALAIRSLCSQIQTEKHLAELAEKPAALVVTKEGLLLGSGAFGCVYRVKYEGRTAACKEARTVSGMELLQREAELLRRIRHPLFPEYYGFTTENGTARLFMEEIDGENLADMLKQGRPMRETEARCLAAELAEGLSYLHQMPGTVLYRDLKPENILVTRKGMQKRVRLLDLGCACTAAQAAGTRAGTPGYAAPEQLTSHTKSLTPACDVYALGMVLRRLLGEQSGSPCLRTLIAACLTRDPQARPSMETVLRTLRSR